MRDNRQYTPLHSAVEGGAIGYYSYVHDLHKIAKYTGKEGILPKMSKIGTATWKKATNYQKKVKDISKNLSQKLHFLYLYYFGLHKNIQN